MAAPSLDQHWRDGAARAAIVAYVEAATDEGSGGYLPPAERIAVFDNDGTAFDVDEYERRVAAFFAEARHPTHDRLYRDCTFAPMVELLRYLEAHGFLTFIVSGGDRDFMRPAAEELYGIPRERVVGSSFGLDFREDDDGSTVVYKSSLDFFDDGPQKPLHIWSRVGRRPAIAVGNSNGDVPMLRWAARGPRPSLCLLVVHDDAEREVDDRGGAEQALAEGFTPISINEDWAAVSGETP